MKKLILFLVLMLLYFLPKAQYFQTGQDPASLRWRQINTDNFQLIYPDYYESQAQKLAGVLETVYRKGGASLHYQPRKISIILHTQTVKSNGLVAWAPKRAEFYTIPHQENYAQDWLEQLAIHEFRHMVQIDKINSEIPKIIKILLGEQGTALVFGAYIPWWFIEGDAVVSETAFSNSGRGRFPSFLVEHKAQVLEKGVYKYDKAYNSSFRDYVPNHYQLGYYLTGAARVRYGSDLWNQVLNRVGSKPFSLTPFNSALKDYTGFTKVKLYNSVFESLKIIWEKEDEKYIAPELKTVSPEKSTYTNYRYGHWLNDTTVISYKSALNRIPAFLKINTGSGREKKFLVPGTIFNESVNYRGEWITWSEQIPDPRWHHSGKSLIWLYNAGNGEKVKIRTEFTAFAPAISPDLKSIAVVESDFSSNYYISVYEIATGNLKYRFQTKDNNYFFSPDWLGDNHIVAVLLTPGGKRVYRIFPDENRYELLIDKNLGEVKNLRVFGQQIYFVASRTGKDELFRFDTENNSVEHIFEPRFGLEWPAVSPDGKKLLVSDYTADGLRLIVINPENLKIKSSDEIPNGRYDLAEKLAEQEPGAFDFSGTDTLSFPSRKYSKAAHLINFHSWAPAAIDVNNYEFAPGVSFLSQNKLGTAEFNLGYKWKLDEKVGIFYGKYSFKGWYPVFDIEINAGKSASSYTHINQTVGVRGEIIRQDTTMKRFSWNLTDFTINARVPLNFTGRQFSRYLQPEVRYAYTMYKHDPSTPGEFFSGNFQSVSYRLYYQQLLKKSYQDVYPNLGFIADLIYRHSPGGDADLGFLKLAQAYLFFPGFMANHGVRIYSGIQDKNSRTFSEAIRYPRGWGKINTTLAYSFAFDYKMPLFYPEWNLGSLVYLKRVKSALFFDSAFLEGDVYHDGSVVNKFQSTITSIGVELTGDANFLRFYAPVEIGCRASYLPENKNVYFDFLISIDFNSL